MKIEVTKTPEGFLIPMIDEFGSIEKEKVLLEVKIIKEENYGNFESFRNPPSLEEMLESKADLLINDIDQVTSDFWPEDESADDINAYIYGQRQKDRLENDE